jgi:hypothetical protein
VVKTYTLARESLTIVRALEIVEQACHDVKTCQPNHAAYEYAAKVVELLPADVRSLGEQWDPGDLGTRDEWARCGAYLGALDGRRGLPMRSRSGGSAYVSAYAMAYVTAQNAASQLRTPPASIPGAARHV